MITVVIPFIFSALASYLLGSISFSIIFTRLFKGDDVRHYGSGNAGTTNVLRAAGKLPALFTLICDFSKAVVAIVFSQYIFSLYPVAHINGTMIKFIAGIFCILGHIYPLYFGFKGGKGVLTAAALVLLIDWRVFVVGVSVFAVVLAISRYVSLSSLTAAASLPVITMFFQIVDWKRGRLAGGNAVVIIATNTILAAFIGAVLFFKHSSNIRRLLNGTESKIGTHVNNI